MDSSPPDASSRPRSPFIHWTDLIVVPLASWLLILLFLYFLSTSLKRRNNKAHSTSHHYYSTTGLRQSPHRYWFPHHLTSIVVVLAIGMSILELVRLGISHQYYGALYFTPVGFGVALIMHYGFVRYPDCENSSSSSGGVLYTRQPNGKITRSSSAKWKPGMHQRNPLLVFWIAQLVVQSIHIGAVAAAPGDNPKYKKSDETLDMAVLIGLIVVLMLLEFFPGQGVVTVGEKTPLVEASKPVEV